MKPFRKINVSDVESPGSLTRNLETIQQNVHASVTELQKAPELNAAYVDVDVTPGTDIRVNHGLGRAFKYYEIVRSDACVCVYDSPTVNNIQDKQLILRANYAAHITLKVT